jgi:hypothetical protein
MREIGSQGPGARTRGFAASLAFAASISEGRDGATLASNPGIP